MTKVLHLYNFHVLFSLYDFLDPTKSKRKNKIFIICIYKFYFFFYSKNMIINHLPLEINPDAKKLASIILNRDNFCFLP